MCSLRRNAALLFWLAVTDKLKCLFTGSTAKEERFKFSPFFGLCNMLLIYASDFKREVLTKAEYIKHITFIMGHPGR